MINHVETHLSPRGMPPDQSGGLPLGSFEPGEIVQLRAVVVRHVPEDDSVEVAVLGDHYATTPAWLPIRAEVTR